MSVGARCGSCGRELLLDQLTDAALGFRCPFCGFAFAPSYASVAPGVAERALTAHHALVNALDELQAMIAGRLLLDRGSVVTPVSDLLPTDRQRA
jgi:hypothetical protein